MSVAHNCRNFQNMFCLIIVFHHRARRFFLLSEHCDHDTIRQEMTTDADLLYWSELIFFNRNFFDLQILSVDYPV